MVERDETRKLLKIFGVATTNFEEKSAELLDRIRRSEGPPDAELMGAVRELLAIVVDVNQKLETVSNHVFEGQRRVLNELMDALSEHERG